jgi:hypothetical protein
MLKNRYSILKLNSRGNNDGNNDSNRNRYKQNQCDVNRYVCLEKIYNYLIKNKEIFQDVIPFIQGGFALYLNGYKEFMLLDDIIGTNDIDIHIESMPDKNIKDYNTKLQRFFVNLCRLYKSTINLNKKRKNWYYGTSKYIDITYEDNYSSYLLYIDFCLNNGYTHETLNTHLQSKKHELQLPFEYVIFNCVHMFCLLLEAFGTKNLIIVFQKQKKYYIVF